MVARVEREKLPRTSDFPQAPSCPRSRDRTNVPQQGLSDSNSALDSADLRQVNERPRARHVADRDLDQRRLVLREALLERLPQSLGIGRATAGDAKALGQPH